MVAIVSESLSPLDFGSYETDETTGISRYTYQIPISEKQTLHIVLLITYPHHAQDTFLEIETWQSEYEIEVPEDEHLDLIG